MHMYEGAPLPKEKIATIKCSVIKVDDMLDSTTYGTFIRMVDKMCTSKPWQRDHGMYPSEVYVKPGKHKLLLGYRTAPSYLSSGFSAKGYGWYPFEANKTYFLKSQLYTDKTPDRKANLDDSTKGSVRFYLEDAETGKKIQAVKGD